MPRIQLIDAARVPHEIESADPEMLGKWLWETIARLQPNHTWPCEIRVWPMWIGQPGSETVDWPPTPEFRAMLGADEPIDNVRGLISALSQHADMLVEGRKQ